MRTYTYSESTMKGVVRTVLLKQKTIDEVCKEYHISKQTYNSWRKKYSDEILSKMDSQHKKGSLLSTTSGLLIGEKLTMVINTLKQIDKDEKIRRKLIQRMVNNYRISEENACSIIKFDFKQYGYKPRVPQTNVMKLREYVDWLLKNGLVTNAAGCVALLKKINPQWTTKLINCTYNESHYRHKKLNAFDLKQKIQRNSKLPAKPSASHKSVWVCNVFMLTAIDNLKTSYDSGMHTDFDWDEDIERSENDVYYRKRSVSLSLICITDYRTGKPIDYDFNNCKSKDFDLSLNLERFFEKHGKPKKIVVYKQDTLAKDRTNSDFAKWCVKHHIGLKILNVDSAPKDKVYPIMEKQIKDSILLGNGIFTLDQFEMTGYLWKTGQTV